MPSAFSKNNKFRSSGIIRYLKNAIDEYMSIDQKRIFNFSFKFNKKNTEFFDKIKFIYKRFDKKFLEGYNVILLTNKNKN